MSLSEQANQQELLSSPTLPASQDLSSVRAHQREFRMLGLMTKLLCLEKALCDKSRKYLQEPVATLPLHKPWSGNKYQTWSEELSEQRKRLNRHYREIRNDPARMTPGISRELEGILDEILQKTDQVGQSEAEHPAEGILTQVEEVRRQATSVLELLKSPGNGPSGLQTDDKSSSVLDPVPQSQGSGKLETCSTDFAGYTTYCGTWTEDADWPNVSCTRDGAATEGSVQPHGVQSNNQSINEFERERQNQEIETRLKLPISKSQFVQTHANRLSWLRTEDKSGSVLDHVPQNQGSGELETESDRTVTIASTTVKGIAEPAGLQTEDKSGSFLDHVSRNQGSSELETESDRTVTIASTTVEGIAEPDASRSDFACTTNESATDGSAQVDNFQLNNQFNSLEINNIGSWC